MNVQNFVYTLRENEGCDIGKLLSVRDYIALGGKVDIANRVIDFCTIEKNGMLVIDSIKREQSMIRELIKSYTNLEYEFKDYDVLCQYHLLDLIFDEFIDEKNECERILNMMIEDRMQSNKTEFTIGSLLNTARDCIQSVASSIEEQVKSVKLKDLIPSKEEISKLNEVLNRFSK